MIKTNNSLSKIETVEQAQFLLFVKGIKSQRGIPNIFYACGNITSLNSDPAICKYFPETGVKNRSCPVCENYSALLTKFKKCTCGATYIGKRVQSSVSCARCANYNSPKKAKIIKIKKSKYTAGDQTDPERWDCTEREHCMDNYKDPRNRSIPCKGCLFYKSAMEDLK